MVNKFTVEKIRAEENYPMLVANLLMENKVSPDKLKELKNAETAPEALEVLKSVIWNTDSFRKYIPVEKEQLLYKLLYLYILPENKKDLNKFLSSYIQSINRKVTEYRINISFMIGGYAHNSYKPENSISSVSSNNPNWRPGGEDLSNAV